MVKLQRVPVLAALVTFALGHAALAYTCDTDKTQVWPQDGVIAPNGFLLVEGEGTWRKEVEHFPIYRLTFVSERESIRAVASLLSEPSALRAQVTIRSNHPLKVGVKYRLKVEATASCVEKPRSDFLQAPRGSKSPSPLDWTVQDPASQSVDKLSIKEAQIATCSKPPCFFRRLEVAVEGRPAASDYMVLLDVREGEAPSRQLAAFGNGPLVAVTENGCNKGTFYDSRGKMCITGRLMSRAGVPGAESAPKCFLANEAAVP